MDPAFAGWVENVNAWLDGRKNGWADFELQGGGVDRHGAIEWVIQKVEAELQRIVSIAIIPQHFTNTSPEAGSDHASAEAEIWAGGCGDGRLLRRLMHSTHLTRWQIASSLDEPFEQAIRWCRELTLSDLRDAAPLPLWRTEDEV
jgi:hypothetical protein